MSAKRLSLPIGMIISLLISQTVMAKVWRVNNTAGVAADFTQCTTAFASTSVVDGDTLYIEGASANYNGSTLTKKLVLIGPGYLLAGTGANAGLQFNPYVADVTIRVDSLASGSQFLGLSGAITISSNTDNITITRFSGRIGAGLTVANSLISNLIISKSYFNFNLTTPKENLQVINCIIYFYFSTENSINSLIRNNVLTTTAYFENSYVANNIFMGGLNSLNTSFRYNIATGNVLPASNGNKNSILATNIFVGAGSTDGYYQLKSGSTAIAAGEPVNGITPDCGVFGTADPYILSGIPPIPTIYTLTVPVTIPASATTIPITISTRSNN